MTEFALTDGVRRISRAKADTKWRIKDPDKAGQVPYRGPPACAGRSKLTATQSQVKKNVRKKNKYRVSKTAGAMRGESLRAVRVPREATLSSFRQRSKKAAQAGQVPTWPRDGLATAH
jgi:hypothetical protein